MRHLDILDADITPDLPIAGHTGRASRACSPTLRCGGRSHSASGAVRAPRLLRCRHHCPPRRVGNPPRRSRRNGRNRARPHHDRHTQHRADRHADRGRGRRHRSSPARRASGRYSRSPYSTNTADPFATSEVRPADQPHRLASSWATCRVAASAREEAALTDFSNRTRSRDRTATGPENRQGSRSTMPLPLAMSSGTDT